MADDDTGLRSRAPARGERQAARARRLTRAAPAQCVRASGCWSLGCGLAALSVVAIWLRVTLLDTDRYVKTVAPIAAEPAVQQRGRGPARHRDQRAHRLRLARARGAAGARRRARARDPDRRAVVHPHADRRSSRARRASRSSGSRPTGARTRGSPNCSSAGAPSGSCSTTTRVYLDLSPAVDRIKAGLQERGLTRIAAAIPPSVDGRIKLVQSPALADAQSGIKLLKAVAIVLPLLALLCLAGSVWLARQRRRGLLRAAIGVALAMLLLVGGARRSPARPTSTRSAGARCRATRPRTSSTRSWCSCATACGS